DGALRFPFRCVVILGCERNLGSHVGGCDRIETRGFLRHPLSFIATASDHGRSGAIELGEIGACFNVLRRELNGLFELRDYFLGETETGKRSTVIGLVSIGATEPEMILGDVGLELN